MNNYKTDLHKVAKDRVTDLVHAAVITERQDEIPKGRYSIEAAEILSHFLDGNERTAHRGIFDLHQKATGTDKEVTGTLKAVCNAAYEAVGDSLTSRGINLHA